MRSTSFLRGGGAPMPECDSAASVCPEGSAKRVMVRLAPALP